MTGMMLAGALKVAVSSSATLAALADRAGIDRRQASLARAGKPIAAGAYLALCGRVGIDPMDGAARVPKIVSPHVEWRLLAAGLYITRSLRRLDQRRAAKAIGTSSVSACDRTSVSTYPLESSKPLESDSPPTPKGPIEGAGTSASGELTATVPSGEALSGLSREESTKESTGSALVGEIITPQSIAFDDFWTASGMVGEIGPAMAAWGKLQDSERAAIGNVIYRTGAINTGGMWACTWLKNRGWERPPPIERPAVRMIDFGARPLAALSPEDEAEQALANGAPILRPYSDEWWAARKRFMDRGQSVYVMDKWAERGKGWPVIDDD